MISFRENKEVDRVTYDLPIDFMVFARYFAFKGLVQALSRQNLGEMISYRTLYFIYQKMGMFPFDTDIQTWAKVLNQGMNAFEDLDDTSVDMQKGHKMVDGWKAFMSA